MNQLSVSNNNQVAFTQEQVSVIKNQIAKDATDMELKSFIYQCERTGLDPFSRQIYFIKSGDKVQIQTSIDGLRLIAERSDKYEGQTQALWCGSDGVWKDIWVSKEYPVASKIGVYKKGFKEPLYAIAHWNEYYPSAGYMQKKMPALMIAKVAESLALRKAFPNEMSGLYSQEELVNVPEEKKITSSIEVLNATSRPVTPLIVNPIMPMVPQPAQSDINAEFDKASQANQEDFNEYVTAPITQVTNVDANPMYVCKFGKKHINKSLEQIGVMDVKSYGDYLARTANADRKELRGDVLEFYNEGKKYLQANGMDYDFK